MFDAAYSQNVIMNIADKPQFYREAFRVLKPGDYVVCAVSGERIPLDGLRYWSVERQEAYASAEIATRRLLAGA